MIAQSDAAIGAMSPLDLRDVRAVTLLDQRARDC
jgi:hypothetical protein